MKAKILLILLLFIYLPVFVQSGTTQFNSAKLYQIEKIFPNPIVDYFFVEIDTRVTFTVFFELIDILGKSVQKWEPREINPGTRRLKLDMHDHHSGIYLLKAMIGDDQVVFRIRKG